MKKKTEVIFNLEEIGSALCRQADLYGHHDMAANVEFDKKGKMIGIKAIFTEK